MYSKLDAKDKELEKEKDLETLYSQRAKESGAKLQEIESMIVGHLASSYDITNLIRLEIGLYQFWLTATVCR
jgi:hypothetical protein